MSIDLETTTPGTSKQKNRGLLPALYQNVWRWHFYAGIIFAPFLIILALSGSVYLFKPQIEAQLYKDMLTVREVGTTRLAPDQLAAAVRTENPGLSILSFSIPSDAKSTVKMSVVKNEVPTTLYADPYTGRTTGTLDTDKTFTELFKKLHSQLLLSGTLPNRIVELAASWGVVLIVTGLYLWWPRGKFSIWGTILPRLGKRGSRQFWRDMHAVPAFWLSLLILTLILTGLPWSGVMGKGIDNIANSTNTNYPANAFGAGSLESVTLSKDVAEDLPWATENIPVPASAVGGYVRLSLNEVAAIADRQGVIKPYTISMPEGKAGVFTVASADDRPTNNATLHIDQYSGAVLTDVRFADYGIMGKVIMLGIAFHEGKLFGLANQILGLIACLGLILISAGSYVMWRKRAPAGKLGAPNKPRDRKVTIGLLIIMGALGIIMPLVGLSILIVLAIDLLVIRRVPALKRWFSA
ncbi:Uncharacterized iron-regulated membrane protein [Paenibacillaceae bacterium GAS479]|nr:Uncharacterized iron-regulated membrane protein [Paenibacillaceae bacterium GAS479]